MNLLDYIWFQTDWFMNLPDLVFVIDFTIFYPAWMGKVLNWLIHEPAWLDKILKWRMGFPEVQSSCSHTKTKKKISICEKSFFSLAYELLYPYH